MKAGSCFFAEISRTMSSLSPGGVESDSTAVTNPYGYARPATASMVFALLLNARSFAVFATRTSMLRPSGGRFRLDRLPQPIPETAIWRPLESHFHKLAETIVESGNLAAGPLAR
jgi:hypothetical protein